jgi:hypothetical protein
MKESNIVKPATVEDILFSTVDQRRHAENVEKEREEQRVRMANAKPVSQKTMDRSEKEEPTPEQLNKSWTGTRSKVSLKKKNVPAPIKTFTCPISNKTFTSEYECKVHTKMMRRRQIDERRRQSLEVQYFRDAGQALLRRVKHEEVLARKRRRGGLTEMEYLRKHSLHTKFGRASRVNPEYQRRMATPGYRDSWLTSGAGPFCLSPRWTVLGDRTIEETVQGIREEPHGDTRSMRSILARSTPNYLANHPNWDKKRKSKALLK